MNDECENLVSSQDCVPRDPESDWHISDDEESDIDFNEWEQNELLEAWKIEEEDNKDIWWLPWTLILTT